MSTDESDDEPSMLEILRSAIEAEDPSQLDTILSAREMLDPDEFRKLHTELIKIYSEKKETDALLAIVDGILSQAQMAVLTKDISTHRTVGNWRLDLDATRADILEKAMMALISLHVEAGKTPGGEDIAAFGLNRMKQRLDKFWGGGEGEVSVEKKWRDLSVPIRGVWERSFAKVSGALDTAINEIGVAQITTEKAPMPDPGVARAAKRAPRLRTS